MCDFLVARFKEGIDSEVSRSNWSSNWRPYLWRSSRGNMLLSDDKKKLRKTIIEILKYIF